MKQYDLIVAGGGAAGFFAAINAVLINPDLKVLILEKGSQFLGKVKVSGGGRCNVTHACFDPSELTSFYPRGNRELLGPFHKFQPADMFQWFENMGVELKVEGDNRVFPASDNSQTIIDCFIDLIKKHKISLQIQTGIENLARSTDGWEIVTNRGEFFCRNLLIATGSSTLMWNLLGNLGLKINSPAPSLFTFNIRNELIKDLMGVVINPAEVSIVGTNLSDSGPLLITHWGLSGPAILKLSAWGARLLQQKQYKFEIVINFLPETEADQVFEKMKETRIQSPKKQLSNTNPFNFPTRFWSKLIMVSGFGETAIWADLNNQQLNTLTQSISKFSMHVNGKSTFKDEFVTCGGVDLKELNFKTMESNTLPGLFFAGEVLDIDAVTGGFNFQAAWTTAYIAAQYIASRT